MHAELLPPLRIKGRDDPIEAHRLLGLAGEPGRLGRLGSALVGRSFELEQLERTFERAVAERACRLFTVLGPAGIGKTRLSSELIEALGGRARVVRGRCLPYGEGITFWPLVEVVGQLAGLAPGEPVDEAPARIGALLDGEEDAERIRAGVAAALGLGARQVRTEETFWAVRKLLEAAARDRPLLVVLDDIHWAEPTLLDLIEYLAGWSREQPILLCCLARPDLLDVRPSLGAPRPNATTILLEPLGEAESAALIENLLGRADVAEEARARIAEAAEGNPLFVEEMLRMLIDEGLLREEGGRWEPAADLTAAAVPPTIHALLSARLDRLGEGERAVVQRAAVVGQEFWWGAVADLSPDDLRAEVGTHLQTLVRKELIRPGPSSFAGEDGFRFGHGLIREAAYASVPKELRADLHERFAAWLERRAAEDGIVGYHLEQAFRNRESLGHVDDRARGLAPRAAERLGAAGRRAFARGDMAAAVNLLERASGLLPAGEPDRLELLITLGTALRERGALQEAGEVLAGALAAATGAADSRLEHRARVERAFVGLYTNPDTEDLRRVAEAAIPVFERAGDDVGLSKAHALLAQVHWMHLEVGAMEEELERGLRHAERSGDERELSLFRTELSRAALVGPRPIEEALRVCEEILERSREDRSLRAGVLTMMAGMEATRGRFEEARALGRESAAIYEELGLSLALAMSRMYVGISELIAGDAPAAERVLRHVCEALERMGERGRLSTAAAFLARALCAQRRFDEAERWTEISEEAASHDDVVSQAVWRGARAIVLVRRGEEEQALRLAREAVALADQTDFTNMRADALMELADVLRIAGDPAEAA
ncbi:MAG: AAA family ATPase, partial [Actinobacteria bacterium]|nr:AAA family ATPase [Actinomycetota bacterium]